MKSIIHSQSIRTGFFEVLLLITTHLKLICVVVHASSISIHLFVTPLMEILQPNIGKQRNLIIKIYQMSLRFLKLFKKTTHTLPTWFKQPLIQVVCTEIGPNIVESNKGREMWPLLIFCLQHSPWLHVPHTEPNLNPQPLLPVLNLGYWPMATTFMLILDV